MQKEEFEDLIGQALSDRDYEIIETVFLYHPAIKDTSGVEEVAELYKSFGMTIFYDMFQRAKKNQDLEDQLRHTQAEVDRIREEMTQNRASTGLDYIRMLDKLAGETHSPAQDDMYELEDRKNPRDTARKIADMLIAEYPDGFSLADVREIFSNIEEQFVNLRIRFSDT